ncbi:FAS-associated factor 1 [Papilio machaon]|uniref:FAS-associated factor 1 n=1 Tax=Papilio machaon TaxID=76193 RepID=A0A194QW61_PAPMA|nr:FAS-associated factor 1 [Papilio machaon]
MAENREEILANFQGITNIEDVAEAILHLDECNWDLLTAINREMPQDGNSHNSMSHNSATHDVEMIDEDISVITPKTHPPDREENNQASTSSPRNSTLNLVELQVHYNNKMHEIKMSGSATVRDLKRRLEAVCGVPVCRQQIAGLGGSQATSSTSLATLGLQRNAVIRLKSANQQMADDEVAERLTTTYVLRVKHDEKEYTLKYPGTKTVQEVKNDIYSLTDVPVRHQVWTGWPPVMGLDDTVLAMVGLDLPQHDLTVRRDLANVRKEYKRIIVDSSDSDNSSVEEIEDPGDNFPAEDDMFDLVQTERIMPLMSQNVEDEALGCIEFAHRFRARYGPNTPNFFEGTLQDTIKESCLKPAKERKLLGVYLHHEQSVLSNVFCAQLLGCDTVLQTLAANFLVYGWDLTHPNNTNMLLNSIANALGPVASMTIRSIPVDRLPALLIIMRMRSNTEIYSVINEVTNPSFSLIEVVLLDRIVTLASRITIKESCLKPAKERKLLGVYLHHEQSVLSNVFCAQLLGCDTVLQTLAANFLVYGWDLTHPNNTNMLLNSIANALGPVASMTIRSIPVDRLPALLIIMRMRSNTEIYSVINGNVGVSELVGGLVEAIERFAAQREEDARLERERDARQRVKLEQDEAYQRSLEADRAKEEIKKQQELEIKQELERAESERLMEEARKEELRAGAEARVPQEPGAEESAEVSRIRVRLPPPHHDSLERRFYATDTLALTLESHSSTLKALKLYPQETIMLEER